ncbi:MAG: hypothetical protein ACTHMM_05485 [Agriterribacter sp.]
MITAKGYSKDPSIVPEGIAWTLPVKWFDDRGWKMDEFKKHFERYMRRDNALWNIKLTNLPTNDFYLVYMIFGGFIQYECRLVQIERNVAKTFHDAPDGRPRVFAPCNWIVITEPAIAPPYEIPQKGFQGFRYTTKLF